MTNHITLEEWTEATPGQRKVWARNGITVRPEDIEAPWDVTTASRVFFKTQWQDIALMGVIGFTGWVAALFLDSPYDIIVLVITFAILIVEARSAVKPMIRAGFFKHSNGGKTS